METLQGTRFRRLGKGVYVAAATSDSHLVRVRGAMLALPPETIATGVTGLQMHGVYVGALLPMTFATTHPRQVRRPDLKVMRLKVLPPHRDGTASPEHCWLIAASALNLLDLVTAGDWLLRRRRTTLAGLPTPECNLIIGDDQRPIGRVDLVYVAYKVIIEYEGDQHRTDRNQWNADIDRHEDFARDNWTLIRVTSERTRWSRQLVRGVYKALKANGYDGPEPEFGSLWTSLFE